MPKGFDEKRKLSIRIVLSAVLIYYKPIRMKPLWIQKTNHQDGGKYRRTLSPSLRDILPRGELKMSHHISISNHFPPMEGNHAVTGWVQFHSSTNQQQ